MHLMHLSVGFIFLFSCNLVQTDPVRKLSSQFSHIFDIVMVHHEILIRHYLVEVEAKVKITRYTKNVLNHSPLTTDTDKIIINRNIQRVPYLITSTICRNVFKCLHWTVRKKSNRNEISAYNSSGC